MRKAVAIFVACAGLAGGAAQAESAPRVLAPGELDKVTAGVWTGAIADAIAGGTVGYTATNTNALVAHGPGPSPVTSGSVGGSAANAGAYAPGGSFDTDVATSGSSSDIWSQTRTFGGTVRGVNLEVSASFTYTVGSTGTRILGGP